MSDGWALVIALTETSPFSHHLLTHREHRPPYRSSGRTRMKQVVMTQALGTALLLMGAQASAQTPATQATNYETPTNYENPPAPGMPLAPRLQNLGVHTFPVTTSVERAALRQSGPQSDLRVQPCRGRTCVRSGAARSGGGDGVLGTGARAGSEHQRADGCRERAQGVRSCRRPSRSDRRRARERRKISTHCRALHGTRGRSTEPIAPTPPRGRLVASFPDDLDAQTRTGSADGSAAVELLDA
jgi:hypothetical protein